MTSPKGILRSLRRKIGRVVYLTPHSQEDTEALYGPNPNNLTPEEKMRSMGPGGGPGYGGATGPARALQSRANSAVVLASPPIGP